MADKANGVMRQQRNATLIEMLQATHEDILTMRKFRDAGVHRVPASAQLGGWARVVASAIAILKEDAEGWCANSTPPPASDYEQLQAKLEAAERRAELLAQAATGPSLPVEAEE